MVTLLVERTTINKTIKAISNKIVDGSMVSTNGIGAGTNPVSCSGEKKLFGDGPPNNSPGSGKYGIISGPEYGTGKLIGGIIGEAIGLLAGGIAAKPKPIILHVNLAKRRQ